MVFITFTSVCGEFTFASTELRSISAIGTGNTSVMVTMIHSSAFDNSQP